MSKDNLRKIKKEFFKITRIIPRHKTNYLWDKQIRRDEIFAQLADRVFDYHGLLEILVKKAKVWLKSDRSEFTYALAGYIYYLKQDFKQAESLFLKAIEINPYNLDDWLDLGFSLYHQDKTRHQLAKTIFFNFDLFINLYTRFHYKRCNLRIIKRLAHFIIKEGKGICAG